MKKDYKIGDQIKVKQDAQNNAGQEGLICGMKKVTSQEEADKKNCKVDDCIYTIEFQNGSVIEVSECDLD